MKFAVFMGHAYYPNGGWEDFLCASDDIDVCHAQIAVASQDIREGWWHIVDLENRRIMAEGDIVLRSAR